MSRTRLWLRRWIWRHIVRPYVDKVWSPADCDDLGNIVSTERWHGCVLITTDRHLYAVGDRLDFIDLSIQKLR